MRKVNAIIEIASDGTISIYSDAEDLGYLVTGTGKSIDEAKKCFEGGYQDIKDYCLRHNEPFTEVEMVYQYDTVSFLSYLSEMFSPTGLSRLTGINKAQISYYVTGSRTPSTHTKEKLQRNLHAFASNLSNIQFV